VIENPLAIIMIGLCSALAVTTSVANGIGMSLAMTFVIVASEFIISLFRKLIPESVRIPIFIIIIAAFTTMVDLVMKAYFPELSKAMGVFIPLIVVNCIIMGRVEAFASKESVPHAVLDALGMGLGNGTILGIQVLPETYQPILFFVLPPGGFLVFALFISLNLFLKKKWLESPLGCPDPEGGK
jgi:electron transport complex protein RnfE